MAQQETGCWNLDRHDNLGELRAKNGEFAENTVAFGVGLLRCH